MCDCPIYEVMIYDKINKNMFEIRKVLNTQVLPTIKILKQNGFIKKSSFGWLPI